MPKGDSYAMTGVCILRIREGKIFPRIAVIVAAVALIVALAGAHGYCGDGIRTAGDIGQIALPAAAVISTLVLKDTEGFKQFVKAFLLSTATTQGLKLAVHERRPTGNADDSFPSGHTTSAFGGAGFLQMRYGWSIGLPAYVAAGFVGYSRVESKAHHVHDVLAGAAIGIGANLIFVTPYQNVSITPMTGRGLIGIQASMVW